MTHRALLLITLLPACCATRFDGMRRSLKGAAQPDAKRLGHDLPRGNLRATHSSKEGNGMYTVAILGTNSTLPANTDATVTFTPDIARTSRGQGTTATLTNEGLERLLDACRVPADSPVTEHTTRMDVKCLNHYLYQHAFERSYMPYFVDLPDFNIVENQMPFRLWVTTKTETQGLYFMVIWDGKEDIRLNHVSTCLSSSSSSTSSSPQSPPRHSSATARATAPATIEDPTSSGSVTRPSAEQQKDGRFTGDDGVVITTPTTARARSRADDEHTGGDRMIDQMIDRTIDDVVDGAGNGGGDGAVDKEELIGQPSTHSPADMRNGHGGRMQSGALTCLTVVEVLTMAGSASL